MDLKRLSVENYDEAIELMNAVFSHKSGKEKNIVKSMPKMGVCDENHARKHFGVIEDDKIVACLGVYPFKALVLHEELFFATVGNVVTHWDYEGNGYMTKMLDCSAKELNDLNVDIARLSGLRSRYNRYGFETCGQKFNFTFTTKNRVRKCVDFKNDIEFELIKKDDIATLEFCANLYNKNKISVPRNAENAYLTMTAWYNIPYIAIRNGGKIGYLCVNEEGISIAEIFANNHKSFIDIICAWQAYVNKTINFILQPHNILEIQFFSSVCENSNVTHPGLLYIRNWEKVVNAFIKLKNSYCKLLKGELNIEIQGYGTIKLYVNDTEAGCVKTNEKADVSLDNLTASRYVFGPYPPLFAGESNSIANAWFPLPLGWNGQDRI